MGFSLHGLMKQGFVMDWFVDEEPDTDADDEGEELGIPRDEHRSMRALAR